MKKPESSKTLNPLTRHSGELCAQILAMLKKGLSQNEIARQLDTSLGTVGYHVARLRQAGMKPRRAPAIRVRTGEG